MLGELDQELLRVAIAEIKARCFKHESLQTDDSFGVLFEHLQKSRNQKLRMQAPESVK